jgi:hypothetical protein
MSHCGSLISNEPNLFKLIGTRAIGVKLLIKMTKQASRHKVKHGFVDTRFFPTNASGVRKKT